MPYNPYNGQWSPDQTSMTTPYSNNLWVGNNYSGYSPNRSIMNPQQTYSPAMTPQTINNIISVMSPESANEFRLGPNSRVILMEEGKPIFFLKCSDDSGFAKTRAFTYHEIPMPSNQTEAITADAYQPEPILYLTKEEFNEFKQEFMDFKNTIEEIVTRNA